jgi:hypothetical protein
MGLKANPQKDLTLVHVPASHVLITNNIINFKVLLQSHMTQACDRAS